MPYVRHENGFDQAHEDHRGGTLGGFDSLIRCRGHYPDPEPCDQVLYAHVPDADVCPNCTVVSAADYDAFHSERTVHNYEVQFVPQKQAALEGLEERRAAAEAELAQIVDARLNREMKDPRAQATAELRLRDLRTELTTIAGPAGHLEAVQTALDNDLAELEQARVDRDTKGESVRARREREGGAVRMATPSELAVEAAVAVELTNGRR